MAGRILVLLTVIAAIVGQAAAQGPENYIVVFRAGTSQEQRAEAARAAGAAVRFNYSIVDSIAITVANPNALSALSQNPSVLRIVPDRPVRAFQQPVVGSNSVSPNAKSGGGRGGTIGQVTPEGVKRVGVPTSTSNGSGVGIAILDTGIDSAHADLLHPAQSFSAFADRGEPTCHDLNGHGTHVAGIATALNNAEGVVGVAPGATPYCVKVLNASGSGSDGDVIAGLDQVLSWNAATVSPRIGVVNMSLGRDRFPEDDLPDSPLHLAIRNLYLNGIVVVVAAGNDASKEVKDMIPAGYAEVFAVSSTTATRGSGRCGQYRGIPADTASFFTTDGRFSSGIGVTVAAPGEDSENLNGCLIFSNGILSTAAGGGTTRMSGTSMASPHVAGAVARWIQKYGVPADNTGVEAIRSGIRNTANAITIAPLDSPTTTYSFDGEREGVVQAP